MLGTVGREFTMPESLEQLGLDERQMGFRGRTESLEAVPGEHNSGATIETKASVIVQPRNRCRAGRGVVRDVHGRHQS